MKKRLFETFDDQFLFLCEDPNELLHEELQGIINFLCLSGVILPSQFRFLTHSLYAVMGI